MCVSPIYLPNPNRGHLSSDIYSRTSKELNKDCSSLYVRVPCGHCSECIAVRQMFLVQRCQMESLSHHLFFGTFTLDNDHLKKLTTSSGYVYNYSPYEDFYSAMKNLRQSLDLPRSFRYLAVRETGGQYHRPHWHALFFVPKYDDDNFMTCISLEKQFYDLIRYKYWSTNVGSRKYPVYEPLFEYHENWQSGKLHRNFDFHYVSPIKDNDGFSNVAFYVTKYILKSDSKDEKIRSALKLNLDYDEYRDVWRKISCRSFISKGFGSPDDPVVRDYIVGNFRKYRDYFPFPIFVNPDSGQTFPLSPYYKSRLMSYDDGVFFANHPLSGKSDFKYLDFNFDDGLKAAKRLDFVRKLYDDYSISYYEF